MLQRFRKDVDRFFGVFEIFFIAGQLGKTNEIADGNGITRRKYIVVGISSSSDQLFVIVSRKEKRTRFLAPVKFNLQVVEFFGGSRAILFCR